MKKNYKNWKWVKVLSEIQEWFLFVVHKEFVILNKIK